MKKENILLVVGLTLIISAALISIALLSQLQNLPYENACKNSNFAEYKSVNNFDMCEDKDGNLHYVKITFKGNMYLSESGSAKEISIGDFRTR